MDEQISFGLPVKELQNSGIQVLVGTEAASGKAAGGRIVGIERHSARPRPD
ncbi:MULTISPECIES: hypothetical protein [Rhizobium/Agrobacterium group]|uniref:hypothetical protein n=1 Tax=Rhizobium/Agrobacterium group TaxID=227290 RepID=UPI001436721B|nr:MULTISPECIES: hypothetical protein [Rhizobium/Agrobacterium group]MBB4402917.1 hypothetical protein [Agrobacterium radiobacter]MBB5589172.1 hypothetical protein [Agrobacterium radiobacter]